MQADEGEERKTFVSTLTRRLPTPFGNAPSYLFVVMRVTFSIILPNVCENRDIPGHLGHWLRKEPNKGARFCVGCKRELNAGRGLTFASGIPIFSYYFISASF
jgi:hypothetical protein